MKYKKISDLFEQAIEKFPVVSAKANWTENNGFGMPCGCAIGSLILLDRSSKNDSVYNDDEDSLTPSNASYNLKNLWNKNFVFSENFNVSCPGAQEFGENTVARFINYLFVKKKYSRVKILGILRKNKL
jgi:hypothetical protein